MDAGKMLIARRGTMMQITIGIYLVDFWRNNPCIYAIIWSNTTVKGRPRVAGAIVTNMEKIRFGVIGVGRMGLEHAMNIRSRVPGAELVAVCSQHEENARAAAEQLGCRCYADVDAMCAADDIDAIAIVSSTGCHAAHIKAALEAGKHVFCEKPLAGSVEECLEVERIIAEHPAQTFMLGFMRRFDRSYVLAKEKIERGDIGKIIMVRCNSQDPVAVIDGAIAYASHSAGIFMDLAVHDMDLIRWFTGSEPRRLMAAGGCYAYEEFGKYGDADNVSCLIENADGTMASIFAGRNAAHGTAVETEIIGTKGSLRIGAVPTDSYMEVLDANGVRRECWQDFLTRWHDAYIAELEYFVDCVRTGKPASPTAADGTAAVRTAKCCREAFNTGKMMEL